MSIVVLYSVCCLISFLCVALILKDKYILKYVLFIWFLSSVFSIIFYEVSHEYDKITISPYIFLIICLGISFLPFYYFDDKKSVIIIKNRHLFNKIILFFCIISILPFFENSLHLISTYSFDNSDELASLYTDKMAGDFDKQKVVNWYSPIGKICNSLNLKFQYCSLFLLFLYLGANDKIKKYKLIAILMGCINPVLYTLAMSGRSAVVFTTLNAIFVYLMFRNYLPNPEINRKIKLFATIIFSVFILLFSIMTFARYYTNEGAQTVSLLGWISLYAGEGTLNFNQYMWNTHALTNGDNCFAFIKYFLGMDTFTDFLDRRAYWGPKMGISPSRFYTFIGDMYSDFGYVVVFIIILIAILLRNKIFRRRSISSFHLYCLFLWGMLCITGITFFSFKVFSASLDLFVGVIILLIINTSFTKTSLYKKSKDDTIEIIPHNLKYKS